MVKSLFQGVRSSSIDRGVWVWFGLSLLLPLYYGVVTLVYTLQTPYLIQDDVRQHVFWMQQFINPDLFQGDLIADYFKTVAPVGYTTVYQTLAQLGFDPLIVAKVLPLILGLIAISYGFWLVLVIFPVPFGAFITSLVLTQSLWLQDDLVTATPRAFIYPILLAFLYYLLKGSVWLSLGAIALQALFYPQLAIVQVGVLTMRLVHWRSGLRLSRRWQDYGVWLLGCSIVLALVLTFSTHLANYGPTVTAAQMRTMPEFLENGRLPYFVDFWEFWTSSDGSLGVPLYPPILWLSLGLPWLMRFSAQKGRSRPPYVDRITPHIRLLIDLLVPSLGLFVLAHLLLLRLYFPDRYTAHSLRIVMAIASGIVLTCLLRWLAQWLNQRIPHKTTAQQIGSGLAALFLGASLVVPMIPSVFFSAQVQVQGKLPELYQFFANQPSDSLVASLSKEVNNIPSFSQRSILTGEEYALPLHLGYYRPIQQRTRDLIEAHYSPDRAALRQFIQRYKVDFFLVDKSAFRANYLSDNNWLMLFQPEADEAIAHFQTADPQEKFRPALAKLMVQCSVLEVRNLRVLDATCVSGARQDEGA